MHFAYPQMLLRLQACYGEAPVASADDGYRRLDWGALVVAMGDGLSLVDEDFGDGVVEGDFSSMCL